MQLRFVSTLAALFLAGAFQTSETPAQPTAPEMLSSEQIQAIANDVSRYAIGAVQSLEFPKYRGDNGVLLAEGDSWFDYPFFDVLQNLEGHYQYRIESKAHKGDTLESMVYDPHQLEGLALKMSRLAALKLRPRAILLSGGGNDVAGPELAVLLNHARSGLPPINEQVLSGVIDIRLRTSYLTFIQAVTKLSVRYFDKTIPILIHGYDVPVPDGRGYLGGGWFLPGPWLKPYLERKGHIDLQKNIGTLQSLIKRFNMVLEAIPKEPGYDHVCYVRVVGTLSTSLSGGRRYDEDWGDELHPSRQGFRRVAEQFQRVLTICALPK